MAIAVPNQWTASGAENDIELKTLPTSGSWVLAVVAWRSTDGTVPQVTVADLPRNLWTLLGTSDHTAAATHAQVWACPKALFDGFSTLNVYVAAMAISASDVGTVTVNAFEVTGLSDAMTIDSVTVGFASAATTFSIVMPAPASSANCLMVGAAAIDNAAATLTLTSGGWTALTQVSRSAPDLKMGAAWRASTATQTPAWSSSVAASWVGIAVAIKEVGTFALSSNVNYPTMGFQLGLGYDVSTPLQAVPWTQPVGRHLLTSHARGIQAELGVAQPEITALKFRNDDGALASRPSQSATLSAAGTTTTLKVLDANAVGLYKGDWFQLRTSAGVLKQTTVFQITATPTSAAGTTTITFSPAASASTASTDVLTTTPVDMYTGYRLLATWAGKSYPVCSGWLGSCVQSFDVESFGVVDASGVDTLQMLDTASPNILQGEILRRNPSHYWTLNDPAGSLAAQNISGVSQAQLVQTTSKFGPGANGVADFGATTQDVGDFATSIVGDTGSGWSQTGLVAADLASKGFALVGTDAFPPIAGGVTIMGIGIIPSIADVAVISAATVDPTMVIIRNDDPGAGIGQGSVIKVSLVHTGANAFCPQITVWDQSTHATTNTVATAFELVRSVQWRTWALTFDRAGWTLVMDGLVAATGAANLVSTFSIADFGGEADAFSNSRAFPGIHSHLAVFPRKLSTAELASIHAAQTAGRLTGETSERRIQRKLATAGWKGARVVATSGLLVAAEDTATAAVGDKAAEVAGYEDGLLFSDAAGQTQFRSRAMSYQQSSRATLGELTGSGEIPYTKDVQVKTDPAFLYNLIRIANATTTFLNSANTVATTTTSVASDPVSAGKYRATPFDRTVRLSSIADAWALACWLLARYATPQRRISQLTLNPAAYPAAFPFVLGVEIGDLVTVNRRPVGAPATSQLYRVLRVAHTQGPGQWTTVLTLALAPAPSLVVGDPVKGLLGSNGMAA